eukprot:m.195288 g.195288  ORF g.195288 m.195288 type:complete len:70 (+) comp17001_c0_seq1:84-293(+)
MSLPEPADNAAEAATSTATQLQPHESNLTTTETDGAARERTRSGIVPKIVYATLSVLFSPRSFPSIVVS